jgi:hypothetical protein
MFSSFETMLRASGFSANRFSDLEQQADCAWEMFIRQVSSFSDWNELLGAAREEWLMRRLGIIADA